MPRRAEQVVARAYVEGGGVLHCGVHAQGADVARRQQSERAELGFGVPREVGAEAILAVQRACVTCENQIKWKTQSIHTSNTAR